MSSSSSGINIAVVKRSLTKNYIWGKYIVPTANSKGWVLQNLKHFKMKQNNWATLLIFFPFSHLTLT